MLKVRVIPCLLLRDGRLVKTIKFKNPSYVGDPVNAVRIYNEKEVDELMVLDIGATAEKKPIAFDLIARIAGECFMPMSYGGGIRELSEIKTILLSGVEKVAINTRAVENPDFVREAATLYGSQSIIAAIDVKRRWSGKYEVATHGGRRRAPGLDPVLHALNMQRLGAGEILLNAIECDGVMSGYDLELIRRVTKAVTIPVIACGGAGEVKDFGAAVHEAGASAVAAGSMVVYQGRNRAVLINFPTRQELKRVLQQ